MNKSDMNELIKEIDIRIERANDKIMPRKVLLLLQELDVSLYHYFEIIKVYLEFFKEEVKSTILYKDNVITKHLSSRIYKAIKYIITGKFEVEIKFVPKNPEEFYTDKGPVEVLITNRGDEIK